jgi:hypothetical protein
VCGRGGLSLLMILPLLLCRGSWPSPLLLLSLLLPLPLLLFLIPVISMDRSGSSKEELSSSSHCAFKYSLW